MHRAFEAGGSRILVFAMLTASVSVSSSAGREAPSPAHPRSGEEAKPKEADRKVDPPSVHLQGKVVNRDGQGVASSEVMFAGPKKRFTKLTDSSCSFTFDGPVGRYTVTVKAGAKVKTFSTEASADKLQPATLVLD